MSLFAPLGDPTYDYSDKQKVGRGTWMTLMMAARNTSSLDERRFVAKLIRTVVTQFKCIECRNHGIKYITEYPPENAIDTIDAQFSYVVGFMNTVAHRVGKPMSDPHILKEIFGNVDVGICTADCGSSEIDVTQNNYELQIPNAVVQTTHGQNTGLPATHNPIFRRVVTGSIVVKVPVL